MMYNVAEKFVSINGEGTRAGQLAVFIRFTGCNLHCSYCDTMWANEKNAPHVKMSAEEIYAYIKETGVKNVTLTGGEPLIQENIRELLELISSDKELYCEIETNCSVDLKPFNDIENRPSFTMDYKLGTSGMEKQMNTENLSLLGKNDTVKFVSGSKSDLIRAAEIIEKYELCRRVNVYISPVFGKIEPQEIVGFMIENKLNNVNLQLQLHKIIWNPEMRGV
ncbi:MAG: putative 7-carboxy-7-deazaguanine synthase QueE [Oscillospiraceae bacterium]|nr:putative 7-carboxy-7-deazaguanine synthase QueE [Oscillospiraceae bacterium]